MKILSILLIVIISIMIIGASGCEKATVVEQNATKTCADVTSITEESQKACGLKGGQLTDKNDILTGCPLEPECIIPNQVVIKNMAFSPAEITVSKGSKVFWVNEDIVEHTVSFDANQFYFINYKIPAGQEASDYFNIAGTYTYHCSIHPSMKGTIIVV